MFSITSPAGVNPCAGSTPKFSGRSRSMTEGFETREGRVRREFLQNIGVIPNVGVVRVRARSRVLGSVEESFIRFLKIGDVFMISGRPVRLDRVTQMEAWVTPAPGALPTVPRWNASKLPLSNRVCQEITAFRRELKEHFQAATLPHAWDSIEGLPPTQFDPRGATRLRNGGRWARPVNVAPASENISKIMTEACAPESAAARVILPWIASRLDCGKANAEIIWKMHVAQHVLSEIPTDDFLLVEELQESASENAARTSEASQARSTPSPCSRHCPDGRALLFPLTDWPGRKRCSLARGHPSP